MLHIISTNIAKKLFDNNEENIDIYVYGLELFISSMFCTLLLLLTGVMTNSLIESFIFILSFSVLRIFTGGFHSNSYLICTSITVSMYLLIVLIYRILFKYITQTYVYIPVFVFTLIIIVLFSPMVNSNKSLDKYQYKKCKIKSVVVATLEMTIYIILNNIFAFNKINIIIPTMFFIDILIILPLILKKGGVQNDKVL